MIGRIIRTRSCKSYQQCLINSHSMESDYCFADACIDNYQKQFNRKSIINNDHRFIHNQYHVIFLFMFPICFTLICLPLCIYYYVYEFDFKFHALTVHILSICNRYFARPTTNININR